MVEEFASGAVKVLSRRPFRRAAQQTLVGRNRSAGHPERGRFTETDLDRLPAEPGLGPKMNIRLACATFAFYQQLTANGTEPEHAIELIGDAAWTIYRKWGLLPRMIARARSNDQAERLRIPIDLFLRFPFSRPAYRYERSTPSPGVVAIDMRRCPIADYLAAHDARELCVGTWCNLDFALAELWGGRLERTTTIAARCDHCDFRFIASAKSRLHHVPTHSSRASCAAR